MKISNFVSSLLLVGGVNASVLGHRARKEDDTDLQEALHKWQTTQECSSTYFARTNATLPASGYIAYFHKWHKTTRSIPENTGKSTYKLFASEHWGSLDFDCKAQFNAGCHVVPECAAVVKATIERGREKGIRLEESFAHARTVYFVMQSFVYLNWDMHGRADSLKAIENSVMLSMNGIVRSFAQQANPKADFFCHVARESFDLALSALSQICAASANTAEASDAVSVMKWIKNINKVSKIVHGLAIEGHNAYNPKTQDSNVDGFKIHLTPQYATDWCSAFGGGKEDSSDKHIHGLRVHIDRILKDFRRLIYETSEIMATSNAFDDWIETPVYEHSSKVMNAEKIAYEENAIAKIQDWAISAVYNGAQCYQKCHTGIHTHGSCVSKSDRQSRYCPNSNNVCQIACWTTIGNGPLNQWGRNHEVALYGITNLQKYGYTMKSIQTGSYENFIKYGNERSHDTLREMIDTPKGNEKREKSGLNLNMCRSPRVQISDFTPKKNKYLGLGPQIHKFPCSCGDWRSNETASFMQKMGFEAKGAGRETMMFAKGLFNYVCPKQFRSQNLSPIESFLAYCAINVRYPKQSETARFVIGERNAYCDPLLKRIQGMTLYEGNRYFCDWMFYTSPLFATEKGSFVYKGITWKNHGAKCKKWVKQNPKVEVSGIMGAVSKARDVVEESVKKFSMTYDVGKISGSA